MLEGYLKVNKQISVQISASSDLIPIEKRHMDEIL